MKSIAIYYRVSTDRQDLASQQIEIERWLRDLAPSKRPEKQTIYSDHGISGKTMNRPGMQKMLEAAFRGSIDTIVVYRLDRFSRHATTAISMLLKLDEAGVGFISVTQAALNLGHENPFRRTLLSAFAEIAEIERETIVRRVKDGLRAARKRGVVLGAPRRIDDEISEKVKSLRSEGLSYRDIADSLSISVGSISGILKKVTEPKSLS